jgi:hypothetical protein
MTPSCSVFGLAAVPSDQPGAERYDQPSPTGRGRLERRTYVFPGGCVTYDAAFAAGAPASLFSDLDAAIELEPRATLVATPRRVAGVELCGVGGRCVG